MTRTLRRLNAVAAEDSREAPGGDRRCRCSEVTDGLTPYPAGCLFRDASPASGYFEICGPMVVAGRFMRVGQGRKRQPPVMSDLFFVRDQLGHGSALPGSHMGAPSAPLD